MKRALLVLGAGMVAATSAGAQNNSQFQPTVQVRYRFESGGRDFSNNTQNGNFSLLRSRLGAKFSPDEDMDIVIMVQDSRFMGEETNTLFDGNADNFDLREGYINLRKFFWRRLDLKLGRMRVKYGEERLVGAVEWSNIGRSFDGGIVSLNTGPITTDFYAFAEVESLLAGDEGDLHVFGLNASLSERDDAKTQLYLIGQVNDPLDRLNRWTGGYFVNGKIGDFEYSSNGAVQWGTFTPDTVEQDVQAYMWTGLAQYRMGGVRGRPGLAAGVDYLSGDGDLTDANYKVFDTLYATNHKFYGFMDFFLNIPLNTFGRGLVDVFGRALVDVGTVPLRLDVHVFSSAQDYMLTSGSTASGFGTEIDLTFLYKYNKHLTMMGGASIFDPGDIFKDRLAAEDVANWAYLMVVAHM